MKYRLTDETKEWAGHIMHRIECVETFRGVKAGEKGGWVESEQNLSQDGKAWVYDDSKVCGKAEVYDNAEVCGNARINGNAKVYGNVEIYSNAKIMYKTDYIVFKNWWSSGRYFTWTRSNDMWKVGCFYGTGEELIKKAYADSDKSGREYERIVNYVNEIKKEL